jgi:H+-transporting ATPase
VELLKFCLILIVASIPVAMPAVLSVTMAIGALALSKMKCIVTRLESLEEMAGIDTLCCDKTGTLTYNKLVMGSPVVFSAITEDELILIAALASQTNNLDPIERTIVENVHNNTETHPYTQIHFIPFDPVIKRSEATIQGPENKVFKVMKGAPQIVVSLCKTEKKLEAAVNQSVEAFAKKGYRTLGVARTDTSGSWQFQGLIPFYDKVRDDSKETIQQAKEHGIDVKMLTGDHLAIAREVAREVGIGEHIHSAQGFADETNAKILAEIGTIVEEADGFSQVFPESKHLIVRALQFKGHIVGMTGDGVNDAPALKQANLGIAVSGASDAARAAASLVLTAPGLSVIIKGINEARRIFERMTTYSIYRIAETIRVMFFMVLSILAYNFYPVSAIMLILLALLNDIPIMTIAYDRAPLPPKPAKWEMHKVLSIASLLGGIGVISSFLLLIIANSWMDVGLEKLQSIIFLKLSLAGHQTLFVARSRSAFWTKPYPAPILITSILFTQLVAALLVGFGILLPQIPWVYIGYIWVYSLIWMLIGDRVKMWGYRHINGACSDLLASPGN